MKININQPNFGHNKNNNFYDYARYYLLFLFVIFFIFNIIYSVNQSLWKSIMWSPIDEVAHYDYIDKLSDLKIPSPSDDISAYTLHITTEVFSKIPDKKIGLMNKSYEAQQPPIYYLLLAVPNYVLKALSVDPKRQILILRLFNQLFILLACVLIILIFKELHKLIHIDAIYGYMLAIIIILLNADKRYGLSNDNLSPLMNNLGIYFLLLFWSSKHIKYATWAALTVTLGFLTKYTNGYMLILYIGVLVVYISQCQATQRIAYKKLFLASSPILLIFLYFGLNIFLYGYQDILKTQATKEYFASMVLPINETMGFIRRLMEESFNFYDLFTIPQILLYLALVMIIVNFFYSIYKGLYKKETYYVFIFIASLISILVLIAALLLNKYRAGVYWFEFRHFAGYILFWMIAIFHLPIFFNNNVKKGFIGLFMLFMTLVAIQAFAITMTMPDTPSQLIMNQGKCLEIPENVQNGNLPRLGKCHGGANQQWVYSSYYRTLRNSNEKCIDSSIDQNFRNRNGSRPFLYDCLGSFNQQWQYDREEGKFYTVEGKCLDAVTAEIGDNGTPIQLWDCNNSPNQKWVFHSWD
jgi:hypothetical protein